METKIFKNYEDFLRRKDKRINGVTLAFLEENKIDLDSLNLVDCEGCYNCKNCYKCKNCVNCENCERWDNLVK